MNTTTKPFRRRAIEWTELANNADALTHYGLTRDHCLMMAKYCADEAAKGYPTPVLFRGQQLPEISAIEKTLRDYGYDPDTCDIRGYEDEHGITWWTGSEDEGPTNYIHRDGRSEFYGAIQIEEKAPPKENAFYHPCEKCLASEALDKPWPHDACWRCGRTLRRVGAYPPRPDLNSEGGVR